MDYKYVIYSHMPYHERDGGMIVMHNFARYLKEEGIYVKIYTVFDKIKNDIFDDYITDEEINSLKLEEKVIIIYTEGTREIDPLFSNKKVVRLMLSELGQNVPFHWVQNWGKNELVYFFCSELRFKNRPNSVGSIYKKLNFLYINPLYLTNPLKIDNKKEYCHTFRKSFIHKTINNLHPEDSTLISNFATHEEMKQIFSNHKYFVCYDPISYCNILAALCGCISIVYPIEGCDKRNWLCKSHVIEYLIEKKLELNYYGVAYGIEDIDFAKNTLHLVKEQQLDIQQYLKKKSMNLFINDMNNWSININTIQNIYYHNVCYINLDFDKIICCSYGIKSSIIDVTNKVKMYLKCKYYLLVVNNEFMDCDPIQGFAKKLYIQNKDSDLQEIYERDYILTNYTNSKLIDLNHKDFIIHNCISMDINGQLLYEILLLKDTLNNIGIKNQFYEFHKYYLHPIDHIIMIKNNTLIGYSLIRKYKEYFIIDKIIISKQYETKEFTEKILDYILNYYKQNIILICKEESINYYNKHNFQICNDIKFDDFNSNDKIMTYNIHKENLNLKYYNYQLICEENFSQISQVSYPFLVFLMNYIYRNSLNKIIEIGTKHSGISIITAKYNKSRIYTFVNEFNINEFEKINNLISSPLNNLSIFENNIKRNLENNKHLLLDSDVLYVDIDNLEENYLEISYQYLKPEGMIVINNYQEFKNTIDTFREKNQIFNHIYQNSYWPNIIFWFK